MGTTAEKLTYLNTTKQLIKESINLTDANITNEPFRQYATILKHRLPEIVGDPSIIWNNYEHVTGSGTNFSISAYNSIIDYSLYGNTTQNGTPTPTAPVPINVVTGNQTISVSDGTNTQSFTINLSMDLCKIGDYKDYIYKNNGKWYLHKEIEKVVLNGIENWRRTGTKTSGNYYFFADDVLSNVKFDNNNRFTGIANVGITTNAYQEIQGFDTIYHNNTYIRSRFYSEITKSMSETDFKSWLLSNNIVVYYVLATPTNEEIKNYDLFNQLNAVSLYTGTNTITVSGDLPATLDLTALKYE